MQHGAHRAVARRPSPHVPNRRGATMMARRSHAAGLALAVVAVALFALDAETGKQLWSLFLGDPLTNTPTVANGKVFTAYPAAAVAKGGGKAMPPCSHALAAFDLKTGNILWQRWIDSDVMSAPVAVDDELYATSFAGTVYKFKQSDGTILSATKSRATSAPVIVGRNIYWSQRADDGRGRVEE